MSSTNKEMFFVFMGPDENLLQAAKGLLNNTVEGQLILSDKKLFFCFHSNIAVDKQFIATHPYIMDAALKEGILFSTLTVSSKKDTFVISKMNKSEAREFLASLKKIITNKE